jgi:hypothetical protein
LALKINCTQSFTFKISFKMQSPRATLKLSFMAAENCEVKTVFVYYIKTLFIELDA